MLSSSHRRATEQAEITEVEEWVGSGRNTPCIQKRARWEGVVEYWPVRRYESIIRVEKSSVDPRSVVDRGAARTSGVWSLRRVRKGSVAVPMICVARAVAGQ
jgi:hypothetical protein